MTKWFIYIPEDWFDVLKIVHLKVVEELAEADRTSTDQRAVGRAEHHVAATFHCARTAAQSGAQRVRGRVRFAVRRAGAQRSVRRGVAHGAQRRLKGGGGLDALGLALTDKVLTARVLT